MIEQYMKDNDIEDKDGEKSTYEKEGNNEKG